jgi:AsmA protein
MVNGTVDVALFQPLIAATLDAAGMPAPDAGNTPVRCLALRAEFSHGVASMQALSIDTPKLSLDGTGEMDFAAETLALHLTPDLHAGPVAATAPVSLTGPFSAPKAALDRVGGRVGFSIGGAASGPSPSGCDAKLSIARGGAPGPMPAQAATQAAQSFSIKKPKDLLKGLFH